MARWMNHAPATNANVYWKKQRRGENKAMHFSALRAIGPSEELCFDYGSDYWDALGVSRLISSVAPSRPGRTSGLRGRPGDSATGRRLTRSAGVRA